VKRKRRQIDAELLDYINITAKRAAQLAVADIFQNIATQLQEAAAATAPKVHQVSLYWHFDFTLLINASKAYTCPPSTATTLSDYPRSSICSDAVPISSSSGSCFNATALS